MIKDPDDQNSMNVGYWFMAKGLPYRVWTEGTPENP